MINPENCVRLACDICGRNEGSTKDRCGEEDGIPLGPIEQCPTCGRTACPDCLHEADCCFVEVDDHKGDANWSPDGWKKSGKPGESGSAVYFRIAPPGLAHKGDIA